MKKIISVFLLILIYTSSFSFQQNEYVIKSMFIIKAAEFISWPKSSGIDKKGSTFKICIIGSTPLKRELEEVTSGKFIQDQIIPGKKIKGKKVEIIYSDDIDSIPECHIVFISKSHSSKLEDIIKILENKPILTVADSEGFASKGVMLNLVIRNNTVKYEINQAAIKKAKLKTDSMFLKYAISIYVE